MDMSGHEKTQMRLFRLILEDGPLTLYTANAKLDVPIGTIHRHIKELTSSKKIKIYRSMEKSGRKKIPYGPTLVGLVYFYRFDKMIPERLESHFLKWLEFDDFVSELRDEGFTEENLARPKETKILFKKYIHYFAGVEDQIDSLRNPDVIPRNILLYIGEFLLALRPEYMRIWEDLYRKMPVIRKNADEYMESTIESYRRLKKTRSNLKEK